MLPIADHLAIHELYAAYNQYIDADRIDDWVRLFTVDGSLVVGRDVHAGHAGLTTFGRRRAKQQAALPFRDAQHWTGNLLLEADGAVVRGSCYLVRFAIARSDGSKEMVSLGRYQDEVAMEDGRWRFTRREAFPL